MRRFTLVGVCLIAASVFAGVSVASASASLPAIMECAPAKTEVVKYEKKGKKYEKTVYTGEYKSLKTCEKSKLYTKDKFRQLGANPGPEGQYSAVELSKAVPFTGSSKGANLEVIGIGGIACTSSSLAGEFTGPKSAGHIVVDFSGCEYSGKKCESAGQAEGTIVTDALKGGVGYLEGKGTGSPKVGGDFSPESGAALATFQCSLKASSPEVELEPTGSVIGEATPVNKFSTGATFAFTAGGIGIQKWKKFQEWLPAEEDWLLTGVCVACAKEGKKPFEENRDESDEEATFVGKTTTGEYLEVKA